MQLAQHELNAPQVWRSVLGELQLQMPRATFDTWVKNTSVVAWLLLRLSTSTWLDDHPSSG